MVSKTDSFNPFAPGFDFLQKLTQAGAGKSAASFPSWTDWVAPTMSVEELEKRIGELKTVLFWLEQNQRALAATIQAMEVQKMTLSTLQTMNVPVDNWASAMVQHWQQFAQGAPDNVSTTDSKTAFAPEASAEPPAAAPTSMHAPAQAPQPDAVAAEKSDASPPSASDPLQWWGALTQQFQHIAQQAVQDVSQHAMQHAASAQDVVASAAQSMRTAAPARKRPAPAAKRASASRASPAKTAAAPRKAVKKPGRK